MAQDKEHSYFSRYAPLSANGNSGSPSSQSTTTKNIEDDMLFAGDESDYDMNGLPYAKPIQRSSFSAPENFDPDAFLVSQHRYQRLEDLQAQLKNWSNVLQQELVKLINRDYADFVGLGKSVGDGPAKISDMKLVVIAFRREVEGIASRLNSAIREMDELLEKKRAFREQENLGRALIVYAQGLQELEIALHINSSSAANSVEIEDTYPSLVSRLKSLTAQYHSVRRVRAKLPKDHPYVVGQDSRLDKIRAALIGQLTSQKDRETKIELLSCLAGIVNDHERRRVTR
ncbi:oligomeric golgi complex component, COG2-domain-containing protein [Lipomyces kononenkoae]|uniref:Oligomeric golgi complex component, COG2-domain-containing protein n=1 Tax=Lipomyces kononenkoae TaxID=34357 RepID=A0ACC3T854_LIPKO